MTGGTEVAARSVYVVVPEGSHDPARPSGGNAYDSRICRGLAALGWSVHERPVSGSWPWPDAAACATLTHVIATVPDDTVVLVDGLIASTAPDVLVPATRRLRLVVLVHMPLGTGDAATGARERVVLSAATALVTTSTWTRRWLLAAYALRPDRVHVAEPGADAADLATGTAAGGNLLCVAAVTPNKGHDMLLRALATVADRPWRCVCVGSLERDAAFVDRLRAQARADGLANRVVFAGTLAGAELDAAYAAADLLVLASHAETYGMVVTEALARGLPVVATEVGGVPEALGRGTDGARPGLLVPPGDPTAFGAALRSWLGDAEMRQRLRRTARQRRETLPGWAATTTQISRVLAEVAA